MADVVILTTGPLYTLEEVKQHLRVDTSDDDAIIQAYMDAAEIAVLQHCNLPIVPVGKEAAFKVAALMYVQALYDEGWTTASLPLAARLLIDPYRWIRI